MLLYFTLQIDCFDPVSIFTYNPLQKQGVLTINSATFTPGEVYNLCLQLNTLVYIAQVTIDSGYTLSSTSGIYYINQSYQLTLTCDGNAATQALCQAGAAVSKEGTFVFNFNGIDTQISQTIAHYGVNFYDHSQCFSSPQITFSQSYSGFYFTGTLVGCDISSAIVNQANPPGNSALLQIQIYDVDSNETYYVNSSIVDEILSVQNNVFTANFDCSILGINCTNVYSALKHNIIYYIQATAFFVLSPRTVNGQVDSEIYTMVWPTTVTNIITTNFPACYTMFLGQCSNNLYVTAMTPDPNANCQIPQNTATVVQSLGIIGKEGTYTIQLVLPSGQPGQFFFNQTYLEWSCIYDAVDTQICEEKFALLAQDTSVTSVMSMNFLDSDGNLITNYQIAPQIYQQCFVYLTVNAAIGNITITTSAITDTSQCAYTLLNRQELILNIYDVDLNIICQMHQFTLFYAQNKTITFDCPYCSAENITYWQQQFILGNIMLEFQVNEGLQQITGPINEFTITVPVESAGYAFAVMGAPILVMAAVVVYMLIRR